MTVCELVDRYLKTKTGVRQSTKQGYVTVQRLLAKETFGKKTIRSVKTSDAKLFLIKLQQEDGKSYSSIHTIRGVLRPAFQMAVDDDILVKNPFGFQLAGVLVNDAVTREVIYKRPDAEVSESLCMTMWHIVNIMKWCTYSFIRECEYRNFVD